MQVEPSDNRPLAESNEQGYLAELWDRREFAFALAFGNLKAKNVSTHLGVVWWVLGPLLLGGVYFLVFGILFETRKSTDAYLAYLLAGLFPFYYTRSAISESVYSVIRNAHLISNLRFPRLVLPISAMIEAGVGFLASLVALYAIAGPFDGVWPDRHIFLLPLAFVLHTAFNLGLATAAARLAVPFRDFNNVIPYLLRLWLYLSPILWPVALVENAPPTIEAVARLNPLFPILALYRTALTGVPFDPVHLWQTTAWALGVVGLGVVIFVRYEDRMARYL